MVKKNKKIIKFNRWVVRTQTHTEITKSNRVSLLCSNINKDRPLRDEHT